MNKKFHIVILTQLYWELISGGHRMTTLILNSLDELGNAGNTIIFNISKKELDNIYVDCARCHLLLDYAY